MKKRTWLICLVVCVGFLIVLGLVITLHRDQIVFICCINTTSSPRELPTKRIRLAFRFITDRELPQKADGLRAIFQGGRDPTIFVRFETDTEGIEYVKRSFAGLGASSKQLDADTLERLKLSGYRVFYGASKWQDELGICLFDQESIESGLEINSASGPSVRRKYHVFIDDQQNTVYIIAVLR